MICSQMGEEKALLSAQDLDPDDWKGKARLAGAEKQDGDDDEPEVLEWKAPIWQIQPSEDQRVLVDLGPLKDVKHESYMQKRAGKSKIRWNIRYFALEDEKLRWWRPGFKDQCMLPTVPKIYRREPRPRPVRCLDLTKLERVIKLKYKFPYSTKLLLHFKPGYTDYKLELRAEKEIVMLDWYKILSRFALECVENAEMEQAVASAEEDGGEAGEEEQSSSDDGAPQDPASSDISTSMSSPDKGTNCIQDPGSGGYGKGTNCLPVSDKGTNCLPDKEDDTVYHV